MNHQLFERQTLKLQNFPPNISTLGFPNSLSKKNKKIVFFSLALSVLNLSIIYPLANDIFVSYSLFTLIFSFYVVSTIANPRSPANFFLCLFLTLGFYVKAFSYLYFKSYIFTEPVGDYNNQSEILARSLILVSTAIAAILTVQKLFLKSIKIEFKALNYSKYFSDIKVLVMQMVCVILVIVICFFNLYYGIYQRGILVNGFFAIHKNLVAWGVLFGFSAMVATFPIYISNAKCKLISFLLVLSTMVASSISALSSTYIVLAASVIFGIYYTCRKTMPLKYFLVLGVFIILSFISSIKIVTELRLRHFSLNSVKSHDSRLVSSSFLETLITLSTGRWVGLESVLAGVSYKSDRMVIFNEINFEKPRHSDKTSLYDVKVAKSVYSKFENKAGIFAMTTPGFIGWASILDSIPFMFILVFFMYVIILSSEYAIFYLTKNLIVTAILGQALAYRFAHFGYMPIHTYKIFLGLFLSVLISYSIHLFITKKSILTNKNEASKNV